MEYFKIHKNKIVVVIISFLFLVVINGGAYIIYLYSCFHPPEKAFKRAYDFDLPVSAEVINYSYELFANNITMKVCIDKQDYESLKTNLLQHAGVKPLKESEYASAIPPNMKGVTTWWDLKTDNIIFGYDDMKLRRGFFYGTSVFPFAFITVDDYDRYYLYCSESWDARWYFSRSDDGSIVLIK